MKIIRKHTKIVYILLMVCVVVSAVIYTSIQNNQPVDGIYGTDRNSSAEQKECEHKTGKQCTYNQCQVVVDAVPEDYKCTPGWKPSY